MPDHQVTMNAVELDLLEQVRQQQGLDNVEQTAEWLAKSRLRRTARASNKRGRALYPVHPAPQVQPKDAP
nr:hypothetical protein [uncultured Albidiferax sp.]